MELSVGEVSGLIAAGVFVLQILLSLVFPAALVGFVGEENTVVTWSVLGRALQSSPWPSILQTDAAARKGVQRRVSNGLLLQTAIVLLISVASIVTPLGLYQTVEADGDTELEAFQFVKDESPFGYGTPPRLEGPFTRDCGDYACPGSWVNETCTQLCSECARNCTSVSGRYIPDVWRTTLREGARRVGQSVSSIFDIQWRSQVNSSDGMGELGWYLKSGYRQIGVLTLDPSIQLVDGLIVDARSGGVGFRNHTVPVPVHEYGSTWTEDILFVEPETQCVDLNFTFDYHLAQIDNNRLTPGGINLTDHGGFSSLSRTSPDLSISKYGNGQGPLDLRERASKAAWANNFLTLAFFNATGPDSTNITRLDVTPGMTFVKPSASENSTTCINSTLSLSSKNWKIEYQAIRSTLDFGDYLPLPIECGPRNQSSTSDPSGITSKHFNKISEICAGGTLSNPANINSSTVGCGLLYGSAYRTDGGDELSPQPGSRWAVPVYSCAASIRATIRTVTFQYNDTGLAGLKAISASPKNYSSPSDYPVWAVEDTHHIPLGFAQPLWGLLGYANTSSATPDPLKTNLSTITQPTLRLPGIVTPASVTDSVDYTPSKIGQNLPGVDFYTKALQNAFTIRRPGDAGYEGYADYSGLTGLAMYHKWQNLSATAEGAARIINLVWTDIVANSVVGTKGWGLDDPAAHAAAGGSGNSVGKRDGGGSTGTGGDNLVPVTVYRRRVRYHLPYMVPAVVVLVLAVGVVVTWLVLSVMGRTGPAKMRRLLDATSPGRILGGFLWPGKSVTIRKTNEWVKAVGTRVVVVGSGDGPVAEARDGKGDEVGEGTVDGEESIQLMGKDKTAQSTPTQW